MSRCFIVKEFDSFTRNVAVESSSYHSLPETTFDQLEQLILTSKKNTSTDAELLEFMAVSSKRGIGKVISVKNYVGLLTMKDGTTIEVLPKIYSQDQESSAFETKRVFLDMLKFLLRLPYKTFKISNVHVQKNSIMEIFIRILLIKFSALVKRGLKSAYIEHQDNEYFYKGKLNFAQHIRANFAHKERFFIEYDVYSVNRVENRLIKSTLELLRTTSSSSKNKKTFRPYWRHLKPWIMHLIWIRNLRMSPLTEI